MANMSKYYQGMALLLSIGVFLSACSDESDPSPTIAITGLEQAESVRIISDALCRHWESCGMPGISCLESDPPQCQGVSSPITYEECYPDVEQGLSISFSCQDYTTELQTSIEGCVNAMIASCVTQAELDAAAEAQERGEQVSWLPAACANVNLFVYCEGD